MIYAVVQRQWGLEVAAEGLWLQRSCLEPATISLVKWCYLKDAEKQDSKIAPFGSS